MSWLDIHKKRMINEGSTIRDAQVLQSVNFINEKFKDAPSFVSVLINGQEYDTRFVAERKYTASTGMAVHKLLFRPSVQVNRGDVAEFENRQWLILFFEESVLYPKAYIRPCNNVLKFKNGSQYPCICDSKVYASSSVDETAYVNLPSDRMKITVSYNKDTKDISELDRFVFNGIAWEVQGFDRITNVFNECGIVEFAVRKVPLKEEEKPIDTPIEIPKEDYFLEIIGAHEVEVNNTTRFTCNVYLNGVLTTGEIDWSTNYGAITPQGIFTAPANKETVVIQASFTYVDASSVTQTITTDKQIDVFDNDDWGDW